MRDHDPNVIRDFLGIWSQGDDDSVPLGFFRDSRNVRFITGGVKSREGTTLDTTIGSVKRMAVYKRIGEAQRLLLLDGSGNLFDSTSLGAPILTLAAMSDFSMVSMFNRAYITPHDGQTGLPGEKVYVYEGSGLARPAAGSPPSGFTLALANSATSGNYELGIHAVGVCFETVSGYVTKPGGFQQITCVGGRKIDISNIPVGPAGTVARVLVVSKIISVFNGNFTEQEYFFAPDGRIANNFSTTTSISSFDADLQASADYLMDQLSEIPAGVGIRNYRGRLMVWGENANQSTVRVSKAGEPESHDAVEGFLTINPGDSGGAVRNGAEYRKQFVLLKSERSYITSDNGENAAFWGVDELDPSVGAECHCLGRIRDFGDSYQDHLWVASRQGIHLFNGTFASALATINAFGIWDRITETAFHTIELVVDPVETLVYAAIPLDGATSPNFVLVGDFQEGLEKIKWDLWSFPRNPQTIVVDVDNTSKVSQFKFGALNGNVYRLNTAATDDFGTAITSYIQLPHIPAEDDGNIYHFTGIRLRAKGSGALDILVEGLDGVETITPSSLTLTAAPGRELFRGFNFSNERCSVKFSINGSGENFTITKVVLYSKILWQSRAQ